MKLIEEIIRKLRKRQTGPRYGIPGIRVFHISEGSGYSEQDAMLVLKDILAHEYMDNKRVDELAKGEKLWRKF